MMREVLMDDVAEQLPGVKSRHAPTSSRSRNRRPESPRTSISSPRPSLADEGRRGSNSSLTSTSSSTASQGVGATRRNKLMPAIPTRKASASGESGSGSPASGPGAQPKTDIRAIASAIAARAQTIAAEKARAAEQQGRASSASLVSSSGDVTASEATTPKAVTFDVASSQSSHPMPAGSTSAPYSSTTADINHARGDSVSSAASSRWSASEWAEYASIVDNDSFDTQPTSSETAATKQSRHSSSTTETSVHETTLPYTKGLTSGTASSSSSSHGAPVAPSAPKTNGIGGHSNASSISSYPGDTTAAGPSSSVASSRRPSQSTVGSDASRQSNDALRGLGIGGGGSLLPAATLELQPTKKESQRSLRSFVTAADATPALTGAGSSSSKGTPNPSGLLEVEGRNGSDPQTPDDFASPNSISSSSSSRFNVSPSSGIKRQKRPAALNISQPGSVQMPASHSARSIASPIVRGRTPPPTNPPAEPLPPLPPTPSAVQLSRMAPRTPRLSSQTTASNPLSDDARSTGSNADGGHSSEGAEDDSVAAPTTPIRTKSRAATAVAANHLQTAAETESARELLQDIREPTYDDRRAAASRTPGASTSTTASAKSSIPASASAPAGSEGFTIDETAGAEDEEYVSEAVVQTIKKVPAGASGPVKMIGKAAPVTVTSLSGGKAKVNGSSSAPSLTRQASTAGSLRSRSGSVGGGKRVSDGSNLAHGKPAETDDDNIKSPSVSGSERGKRVLGGSLAEIVAAFKQLQAEKLMLEKIIRATTPLDGLSGSESAEGLGQYLATMASRLEQSAVEIRKLLDLLEQQRSVMDYMLDTHQLEIDSYVADADDLKEALELAIQQAELHAAEAQRVTIENGKLNAALVAAKSESISARTALKEEKVRGEKAIKLLRVAQAELNKLDKARTEAKGADGSGDAKASDGAAAAAKAASDAEERLKAAQAEIEELKKKLDSEGARWMTQMSRTNLELNGQKSDLEETHARELQELRDAHDRALEELESNSLNNLHEMKNSHANIVAELEDQLAELKEAAIAKAGPHLAADSSERRNSMAILNAQEQASKIYSEMSEVTSKNLALRQQISVLEHKLEQQGHARSEVATLKRQLADHHQLHEAKQRELFEQLESTKTAHEQTLKDLETLRASALVSPTAARSVTPASPSLSMLLASPTSPAMTPSASESSLAAAMLSADQGQDGSSTAAKADAEREELRKRVEQQDKEIADLRMLIAVAGAPGALASGSTAATSGPERIEVLKTQLTEQRAREGQIRAAYKHMRDELRKVQAHTTGRRPPTSYLGASYDPNAPESAISSGTASASRHLKRLSLPIAAKLPVQGLTGEPASAGILGGMSSHARRDSSSSMSSSPFGGASKRLPSYRTNRAISIQPGENPILHWPESPSGSVSGSEGGGLVRMSSDLSAANTLPSTPSAGQLNLSPERGERGSLGSSSGDSADRQKAGRVQQEEQEEQMESLLSPPLSAEARLS